MRVALALVLCSAVAHADTTTAPPPDLPKKDRERAGKSIHKRPIPLAGKKPAKLVNFYNTWTHEWLAVEPGVGMPQRTLDNFLRDHYTNKPTTMEPKLVDILLSAARGFNSDQIMVVSAFRHPKYNLILRKKGHQVARDSHHTKGNAVDFYIPRVSTNKLHSWAKEQSLGGVGIYLDSGFVHMDTGKIRYWSGE